MTNIIYIYRFLELQRCLHRLQGGAPLHGGGFGDVLEDNLAAPAGLVLHELLPVLPLLVRVLGEELCEPVEGLVVTGEPGALKQSVSQICRIFNPTMHWV